MQLARFYGVGIFISTLFLYWVTSWPTVAYIDSGELAVVNWTLGIAHPTGYPLYTLLGRLFALLPFELISTQNLFGALCTAGSVTILYSILNHALIKSFSLNDVTAATLALLFGVAPLVWSQGTTNEVYSLHLLLLTLILWCFSLPSTNRVLLIGAYLFGLSFGNHMSTILLTPVLLVYLFQNRGHLTRLPGVWAGAVLLFGLGISTYLYLPIRSALEPLFNWGQPHTWENFIRHVSGWQYQVWMFSRDASSLVNQLSEFASLLYSQFPLPFWPAIVWGMYAGWKRNSRMQTLLIVLLATNLIYSLNFSIPDIDNYLLPSVVVILIIGAVGLTDLTTKIRSRFSVAAAIAALLIAWSLIVNWQAMDNSKNYAALDGVHNYYNSVAAPALIFCSNWDYVSPWYYSHYYLKEAPQVLIVDNELLRRSWYFDWLEQTDSSLYEFVRPEYEAFLPHLLSFEAGLPYDGSAIEQAYRALLKKFTNYAGRRFYFEQSVQLSFRLDGQIQVSGKLFHLVREGERFTPPVAEFVELRFGKPEAVLNERELLHLRLFRGMTAIPQQERER